MLKPLEPRVGSEKRANGYYTVKFWAAHKPMGYCKVTKEVDNVTKSEYKSNIYCTCL